MSQKVGHTQRLKVSTFATNLCPLRPESDAPVIDLHSRIRSFVQHDHSRLFITALGRSNQKPIWAIEQI